MQAPGDLADEGDALGVVSPVENPEFDTDYVYAGEPIDADAVIAEYKVYADRLRPMVRDTTVMTYDAIKSGKEVLFEGAQAGSIPQDWCKGYEDGAVAITDLGPEVADGTAEKVAEVEAALKDGSLHVFDTSKFTVDGKEVTSCPVDLTYYDFSTGSPVAVYPGETKEAISDGYFHESEKRSAPCFDVQIDGITLLDTKF